MSTNKEAFKKSFVKEKSVNYLAVFKRYGYNSLNEEEYEKLYRYLKPLYAVIEDDYVLFKYPNQRKLSKLLKA